MSSDSKTKAKVDRAPNWVWLIFLAIVAVVFVKTISGESSGKPSTRPLVPIGGLAETPEEKAAYEAAVDSTSRLYGHSQPSPASKELLSATSDFNFDKKVIEFKPGESKKIVLLELGKTSPKIIIPGGPAWRLKLIDSTEVWLQSGIKYMDTPEGYHDTKGERVFRLTGRNPVRIVLF